MKSLLNTSACLTTAVALLALWGAVGQIDYEAARVIECGQYATPHEWDKATDSCIPLPTPEQQPEEHYRGPNEESRPERR